MYMIVHNIWQLHVIAPSKFHVKFHIKDAKLFYVKLFLISLVVVSSSDIRKNYIHNTL